VDRVNEVLRLSRKDIEETPSIVSGEANNRLMQGICKIDDGKRMVVLLDVSKILDQEELHNLKEMTRKKA
jgi:purine-binding chemotaxis protein CheW